MKADATMKFDEALQLLNEAAKDKKEDFVKMITDKYENVKDALTEVATSNKDIVEAATKSITKGYEEGKEKALQYSHDLNKAVHEHPWSFIGGIAAGSLIAGAFLRGHKK